jgi:hypothetical protein
VHWPQELYSKNDKERGKISGTWQFRHIAIAINARCIVLGIHTVQNLEGTPCLPPFLVIPIPSLSFTITPDAKMPKPQLPLVGPQQVGPL